MMVLANSFDQETQEYRYVNGDLGEFLGTLDRKAQVRLQRTGCVETIPFISREVTEPLEVGEKKALKAAGQESIIKDRQKITGAVSYVPLRIAWASTVHKSQGLSLDHLQVCVREGFFAAPNMVYVALSRCRSLEGLRIVGTPETLIARCKTDKRLAAWI